MGLIYFGGRWDAPAVDAGLPGPTPVGRACLYCHEPIVLGEWGFMMPCVRMGEDGKPVGSAEPAHRECLLWSTAGSVEHLRGRCTCYRGASCPEPERTSLREQARATWEWLERHRS